MTGRAKIGFGDALGDLGGFAPPAAPRKTPAPSAAAAAEAGFVSREPQPSPAKQQRRHRTGRSAQINIKAKPETIAVFTAWADRHGMSIAEAFEAAVSSISDS